MGKIFSFSFICILLTSCASDNVVRLEKENTILKEQISKLENKAIVNLFDKKKECAKYQDDMIKDINNPTFSVYKLDPVLEEIFYSPKLNSCLYVYRHRNGICLSDNLSKEETLRCLKKDVEIVDFFTKNIIYSSIDFDNCFESQKINSNFIHCETISDKIEQLKN